MITAFLGVALVAAPFFIKSGAWTTTVQSQEFFLAIISGIGALVFGLARPHRNILIMAIGLFAWAFTTHNPFGVFQYYQLTMSFCGVIFLALIYSHLEEINHKLIHNCLGAICLLECLWVLAQDMGYNPHMAWMGLFDGPFKIIPINTHKLYGSLGNVNHSAALIAVTMPFLTWRAYPICVLALGLAGSALPIICAFIAILAHISYATRCFAVIRLAGVSLIAMASMLFAGVFDGTVLSDTHRIKAWTALVDKLGVQLWGKGLGWIPEVFSKTPISDMKFYQAHNEWLELYAISGLLGVVVGLFLILPVFKNKGNHAVNACLIAMLVNSLGNFTFHIAPLFMVFAYGYAIQLGKSRV